MGHRPRRSGSWATVPGSVPSRRPWLRPPRRVPSVSLPLEPPLLPTGRPDRQVGGGASRCHARREAGTLVLGGPLTICSLTWEQGALLRTAPRLPANVLLTTRLLRDACSEVPSRPATARHTGGSLARAWNRLRSSSLEGRGQHCGFRGLLGKPAPGGGRKAGAHLPLQSLCRGALAGSASASLLPPPSL